MLIDEIKIEVKAGKGGDGIVAFNKNKMSLGPTGGDGGNGGNVYFEAIGNIGALIQFRYKKQFEAENGKVGGQQRRTGRGGHDLILKIPVGTVIHNLTAGVDYELEKIGQKVLIAKGGKGGRGNFFFRSPRNTTPMESESGTAGEKFELQLELKLIADIGLVGFPNAGKSSLLNKLTRAQSRVANYPFTTLEPSLGVYYELILADIPGLIEGASSGKGLGIKFLRHVERTSVLFHLISAESEDLVKDYKIIRKELESYNPEFLNKKEFLMLSKCDLLDSKETKEKLTALKKMNKNAIAISIETDEGIDELKKILNEIKEKKIVNSK